MMLSYIIECCSWLQYMTGENTSPHVTVTCFIYHTLDSPDGKTGVFFKFVQHKWLTIKCFLSSAVLSKLLVIRKIQSHSGYFSGSRLLIAQDKRWRRTFTDGFVSSAQKRLSRAQSNLPNRVDNLIQEQGAPIRFTIIITARKRSFGAR